MLLISQVTAMEDIMKNKTKVVEDLVRARQDHNKLKERDQISNPLQGYC